MALEMLGYIHCAHGFDTMDDPAYAARWEQAINARYYGKGDQFDLADWDEVLGHCSATTDFPCALFWRELCAAYPEAKVVLVQRDEDRWYKSFVEGVIDTQYSPSGAFVRDWVEPLLGSILGRMSLKLVQSWLEATTADGLKANARNAYRRHYKDVKAVIAKKRLLEYQLGSGWQPLCDFLGRDVPDAAFPWVNEADALNEKIEGYKAAKVAELQNFVVKRGLPVVVSVVVAIVAWRWI